ncbi:type III-B CRISPR module-associated protein Cmr5 [Paenibacillus sp. UMB4589-SE434]|uniref:type III-B CRISPR module-associated protein Cmr5 n=1 Tax=Paenibacillus sp. UMB4589-SE434 TaxID=3046314 RepID=UPI00255143B2|nr:type III-B CRISPR module-associated protein Cmr5 [Paenibacillus sp. UMB4589-SE434]MDK8180624.1 type III-B CRISPR module-associated protein Cmr5 [Paenibacillus sp. UMB4589-SE434]
MKSVQHDYATTALRHIHTIQAKCSAADRQQYGSLCHRFPAMVQLNGLRLTVAFLSIQKGMRGTFLDHINEAIQDFTLKPASFPATMQEYRVLTHKVLEASVWYKRYAEAVLGISPEDVLDEQTEAGL